MTMAKYKEMIRNLIGDHDYDGVEIMLRYYRMHKGDEYQLGCLLRTIRGRNGAWIGSSFCTPDMLNRIIVK